MIGIISHMDKRAITLTYDNDDDMRILTNVIMLIGERNSLLKELEQARKTGVLND